MAPTHRLSVGDASDLRARAPEAAGAAGVRGGSHPPRPSPPGHSCRPPHLFRNKLAADLAPPFAILAARCTTELIAQPGHWGAEIDAQAVHLASQIKVLRPWPKALVSEPEESLQSLGSRLANDIATGDAADHEWVTVAGDRARNITSLIDDLNALRAGTLGRLITHGTRNKQPADWPRRFFYRARTQPTAVALGSRHP